MELKNSAQEKIIKAKSGWAVLILSILLYAADIFALGICGHENGEWLRRGFRTLRRSVCPDNDLRLFGMDMVART